MAGMVAGECTWRRAKVAASVASFDTAVTAVECEHLLSFGLSHLVASRPGILLKD